MTPIEAVKVLREELRSTGNEREDARRDFFFHLDATQARAVLKYIDDLELVFYAPRQSLGGF